MLVWGRQQLAHRGEMERSPTRKVLTSIAAACLLISGTCLWIGIQIGQASELAVHPSEAKEGYTLVTWEDRSHDLCFVFTPKTKTELFWSNWFNKYKGRCGTSHLIEELKTIPPGTYIEWNNRPPRFIFPRQKVAAYIGEFAKSRGLDWHENPALDLPVYSDDEDQ
jgi:hypothetical protein